MSSEPEIGRLKYLLSQQGGLKKGSAQDCHSIISRHKSGVGAFEAGSSQGCSLAEMVVSPASRCPRSVLSSVCCSELIALSSVRRGYLKVRKLHSGHCWFNFGAIV